MKEYALGLLLLLATPEELPGQGVFETQPVLKASNLAPAALLKGPHFAVDERVPTTDFLARFTLRSDYGVVEIHGREMLAVRVAEVGALEQLAGMSRTEEFLKAAGAAAMRPVKAAGDMAAHPVETVKGAPAAVGRFFDRVELGAKRLAAAGSSPGKTSEEKAVDVTKRVGGISADVLGYEQERRELAKRLGVDPYTTNPALADKLDEVAWVTFSGRLGMNTLTAVVVPFSIVLTVTTATRTLVWDTPPGDLVKLNEKRFHATGATEDQVRALIENRWYSLSVLTALGTALESLAGVPGRDQIVVFAARAQTEDAARLAASAATMLATSHAAQPLARVSAPGPLAGRKRDGALIVPAPLDYVAWTERVATFAKRPELRAKSRTAWVTGTVSPRAKTEMAAAGWTVREGAQPSAMR
jgi:hypothetical protein